MDAIPEWSDSGWPSEKGYAIPIDTGPGKEAEIETLDILIFRRDSLRGLEAYQRFFNPEEGNIFIASTSGEKEIYACANCRFESTRWMSIDSPEALDDIFVELEAEDRERPSMSGHCLLSAGNGKSPALHLERITSEVVLNSIRCDFSGKPYEREPMRNARAYLINVNARSRMFDHNDGIPLRMVNVGTLNRDELTDFSYPGLLMQELPREIGEEKSYTDIHFVCCPNNGTEEGPGSPFTRLVIEGSVQGETYYWAETVNRTGNGAGIGRADRYVYDIEIRRKGSRDPDYPAAITDSNITYMDTAWNE